MMSATTTTRPADKLVQSSTDLPSGVRQQQRSEVRLTQAYRASPLHAARFDVIQSPTSIQTGFQRIGEKPAAVPHKKGTRSPKPVIQYSTGTSGGEKLDPTPPSYLEQAVEVNATVSTIDYLVLRLERLSSGWAGTGSRAPRDSAIDDAVELAYCLPVNATLPEIEVDPDTGTITLFWSNSESRSTFALSFDGSGRVLGTIASLSIGPFEPWIISVRHEVALARKLETEAVRKIIVQA
jgi:hypothetical protein